MGVGEGLPPASMDGADRMANALRETWKDATAQKLVALGTRGLDALVGAYRRCRDFEEYERLDRAVLMFGSAAVPRMIELLSDAQLESVATSRLGALGDRRAVPALISALPTLRHPISRESAVEALGKLRDPRALGVLVAALDDERTRLAAIEALKRLNDRRAVPALRRYASGDSGSAQFARDVLRKLASPLLSLLGRLAR